MTEMSNAKTLPFEFTGKAGEFFGIWIVNILLTIVTLGFYTPWAKVRTRRYFYGNTILDNSAFDYTADPWAIFKGYLIALVFFILYSLSTQFFPLAVPLLVIVFLLALPWLVVRSMMFTAYNSVFRNLRFSFKKSYKEAFIIFLLLGILVPFTLGLIMPYIQYRQSKFFVENSGFGKSNFQFHADAGEFYVIFLKMIGLMVVPMAVVGILAAIAIPAYQGYMEQQAQMYQFIQGAGPGDGIGGEAAIMAMVIVMYAVMILFYVAIYAYMQSRMSNLIWNNVEFVTNRFESKLRARDMAWIISSNILAIVVSFGLLIPWTKVRMAKYRASKMAMLAVTDLDGFIKYEQGQVSAVGDEVGEMFDIDVGL